MKCPECGKEFTGRPALSRKDNETLICPDCGIRQAMAAMGVGAEETEKIVGIVHEYTSEVKDK